MKSINEILNPVYGYIDMVGLNTEDLSGQFIQDMNESTVKVRDLVQNLQPWFKELTNKLDKVESLSNSTVASITRFRRETTLNSINLPKGIPNMGKIYSEILSSFPIFDINFFTAESLANIVAGETEDLLAEIVKYPNKIISQLNEHGFLKMEPVQYFDDCGKLDIADPEISTKYFYFDTEERAIIEKTRDSVLLLKDIAASCTELKNIISTQLIPHCNKCLDLIDKMYTFSKVKIVETANKEKCTNLELYSTDAFLIESARCISSQTGIAYTMVYSTMIIVLTMQKLVSTYENTVKLILETI